MTVLFLDFDGVLHPNEVYMFRERGIVLDAGPEHALFEHAELLASLLAPFPDISIVLSTSWCASLRRFDEVKRKLPLPLQRQVVGATWHSSKDRYRWAGMTRFEQIYEYVMRHQLNSWVAIDDDDERWPEDKREHLVHTDQWLGLSKLETQLELHNKLSLRGVH